MNKDKQIEERYEIAEIIARESHYQDDTWNASDYEWAAHCVLEAGYRKQKEGEWETILHYKGDALNAYSHICRADGCGYFYKDFRSNGYKHCPNCGAKMNGGEGK